MSESTSWAPGFVPAAAYYNEDYLSVPGVVAAAAYYNEDYPSAPGVVAAAAYNEEYLGAPGVRFVPTDHELIVDYLGRKLRGEPLPTDIVHEGHDAYAEHPKKLVARLGEGIEGSWYLFSPRMRKYAGGMRPKRNMGDYEGHWKATAGAKDILGGTDGKEVIGTVRGLTFQEDTYELGSNGRRRRVKKPASKPSKWKMLEFVCSDTCRAPGNDDTALDPMLLNHCVLCKITDRSLAVEGDEEQPTSDGGSGGGEPYEKHLPEQEEEEEEGGGGAGTQAGQVQQQQGLSGGGAASHGNQQPAPAEAPLLDCGVYLGDILGGDAVYWFANTNNMLPSMFEWEDAQTAAGQQQASSGCGAG